MPASRRAREQQLVIEAADKCRLPLCRLPPLFGAGYVYQPWAMSRLVVHCLPRLRYGIAVIVHSLSHQTGLVLDPPDMLGFGDF